MLRIPMLRRALNDKDELLAMRTARYWVASKVNACHGPGLDYFTKQQPSLAFEEELALLDRFELGYACGGFAFFFSRVCTILDIPNAVFMVGIHPWSMADGTSTLGHVLNLVEVTHQGRKITIAVDSNINGEYGIQGQEATHFLDLIRTIRSAPEEVGMIDHYPASIRTRITTAVHEVDGQAKIEIIRRDKERMTWLPDFFFAPINREERGFIGERLGLSPEQLSPYHLLLFHGGVAVHRQSPTLQAVIDAYINEHAELQPRH